MKCALAATNLNGSLIQITCSMEGRMLLLRYLAKQAATTGIEGRKLPAHSSYSAFYHSRLFYLFVARFIDAYTE